MLLTISIVHGMPLIPWLGLVKVLPLRGIHEQAWEKGVIRNYYILTLAFSVS
jgi:hypothetical protein